VPFLYYGDEIGMKYQQLVSKEGGFNRTGSRTPMQWSNEKNLGFSTADEKHLYLPVDTNIDAPNVEKQKNDKDSMLCFIKELLALRKVNKELGAEGDFEILYAEKNEYPLMYKRGKFIVAVNPSGKQVSVPINQRGKVIYSIGDCNCENKKVFLNEQSFCVIEAEK
ncbi:MAG: glycosylase, partial [Oscillospiraceae bacterium]